VTIRCTCEDFYPYVSHGIYRNHHDITNEGKSTLPGAGFPQKFVWEHTVTPTSDWHNSTLRCTVKQGNSEHHAMKHLDVLFTPKFIKCHEGQHIDSSKEQATIECSYGGNPKPTLTWYRASDNKSLIPESGVTVDIIDEQHGKYKSVVKFERDKLIAIPTTTAQTTTNAQGEIGSSTSSADNYYQQLLNNGFLVKLTINGVEKDRRSIKIFSDANQARSQTTNRSTSMKISTCLMLFSLMAMIIIGRRR
jgi:hypothetical protein